MEVKVETSGIPVVNEPDMFATEFGFVDNLIPVIRLAELDEDEPVVLDRGIPVVALAEIFA